MTALQPKFRQFACMKAFARFMQPLDIAWVEEKARGCRFGKNARKIFFRPYFTAWLLFYLTRVRTLRDHAAMIDKDPFYLLYGGHFEASLEALSNANGGRALEPFVDALNRLIAQVRGTAGAPRVLRDLDADSLQEVQKLLTRVHLFDSTSCELSPKLASTLKYCKTQAGVRVQLKLAAGYQGIEKIIITTAQENDTRHFEQLLELDVSDGSAGPIYLFDCGYYRIKTYDQITEGKSSFVTQRHGALSYHVVKERRLPKESVDIGYTLVGDYEVTIGQEDKRSSHRYRLIKVLDSRGNPLEVLTNILTLPAWKVCLLYRYRWTIEIVFRWIKRTLQVKNFVSYSTQGVQRQLLMALIVYCLLALYHKGGNLPFSPTEFLRELEIALSWLLYVAGYTQGCLDAGLPPPRHIPPLPAWNWPDEVSTTSLLTEVPCRITLIQTT